MIEHRADRRQVVVAVLADGYRREETVPEKGYREKREERPADGEIHRVRLSRGVAGERRARRATGTATISGLRALDGSGMYVPSRIEEREERPRVELDRESRRRRFAARALRAPSSP